MRSIRCYCENVIKGEVELGQGESGHVVKVLRLGAGDSVEVFDGKGKVGRAVISKVGKKKAILHIDGIETFPERTEKRIVIAASMVKGQRFDLVLSKCTELGVDHIVPVLFERTVKQASGLSVQERYRKLTISAAEQCGRNFLPLISPPVGFEDALNILKSTYPGANFLFGGFGDKSIAISDAVSYENDIVVFVGPEGGLSEGEMKFLREAGGVEVCLGDTVLRSETAAISFGVILCLGRYAKEKG